jgi:hypothetical protein
MPRQDVIPNMISEAYLGGSNCQDFILLKGLLEGHPKASYRLFLNVYDMKKKIGQAQRHECEIPNATCGPRGSNPGDWPREDSLGQIWPVINLPTRPLGFAVTIMLNLIFNQHSYSRHRFALASPYHTKRNYVCPRNYNMSKYLG